MTEKEKMIAGILYDAFDSDLIKDRKYARQLAIEYNRTNEDEKDKRQDILKKLLGSIGENVNLEPDIRFDYGYNTTIGSNCAFNFNNVFLDCAPIKIGDNVLVGPNVSFLTPVHPLVSDERNFSYEKDGSLHLIEYAKPITIGNNVWICGNVTINGGVNIGDDVVIASGSVVTRDIPSGVIAAGVPCKVIREITDEDRMFDR